MREAGHSEGGREPTATYLVDRDGVLPEHRGGNHGHLVPQETGAVLSTVWEQA